MAMASFVQQPLLELLRGFQSRGRIVLFATCSFWQLRTLGSLGKGKISNLFTQEPLSFQLSSREERERLYYQLPAAFVW